MSDTPDQPTPKNIQVQIDESVAQGTYVNMALIAHTESEFVVDFIFVPPTRAGARVRSRVILSPRQAKRIAASLVDGVRSYEERFGPIPEPKTPEPIVH